MPRRYPAETRRQVIELARSGTKVKQLAQTFQMSEVTIVDRTVADGMRSFVEGEQAEDLSALDD